jgi:hypothetical protein
VLGLPELELAWSAPNSRYEATTDTFTMLGAYAVNIYARDIWGGVAYPKQTYINQGDSDEQVIIVCGDGDYDSNSPWAFSDSLAQTAYETALARWLVPDKITYLTSGAHPGQRDGAPTRAALQSAIASAAGATQLTVYLVGKGSASAFDMDGDDAASDPDDVTPADLDAWLDALQNAGSTRVIVILDFNRSGAWMAPLSPPPAGKKRIVVTSCSGAEASWCEEGGLFSFSAWFLSEIFNGVNIRDAFNWARLAVRAITGETQNAQLDDDGSGIGDWRDGALARTAYIGAAFVTGADEPTIGDYARDVPLPTNTATLWASGVWAPKGIAEVFAYVVLPGAGPDNNVIEKVVLSYNAAAGRYEADYSNFTPNVAHPVVYFVKDQKNKLSSPYRTSFGTDRADIYDRVYEDGTPQTLNFFSNDNAVQIHNLWNPGDVDWAAFNADASRWYSIQVSDQATSCDAIITLYAHSDTITPLVTRDDWGPGGPAELISWFSGTHSGTMLVKVTQSPRSVGNFGDETTYTLSITGDWGPNAGLGTISGTRGEIGPEGGTVQVHDTGIYTKTNLVIPAGALAARTEFILDDPGDIGSYPWYPATVSWLTAHPGNATIVNLMTPEDVVFAFPATLTLQFINDGPSYNEFALDDLPDPEEPQNIRVFSCTGGLWSSDWTLAQVSQTVNVDTVTVLIPMLSGGANLFAIAPIETSSVAGWMFF